MITLDKKLLKYYNENIHYNSVNKFTKEKLSN